MSEASSPNETHRVAVALFDNVEHLNSAITELCGHGFDRAELSLLAHDPDDPSHAPVDDTKQEATDLDTPTEAPVVQDDVAQMRNMATGTAAAAAAIGAAGITIMTGGTALLGLGAAAAAGLAAGGAVNVAGQRIGDDQENFLREQLAKGGVILWVNLGMGPVDEEKADKAKRILNEHHAHDVRVTEVPYRQPS